MKLKPIRIIYDAKGNTLHVGFSDEKEAYCTESDIDKEVVFSKVEDGSVIGFEILNYFPSGTKMELATIPIETKIVKESSFLKPE